jgi:hypothetical protein
MVPIGCVRLGGTPTQLPALPIRLSRTGSVRGVGDDI